ARWGDLRWARLDRQRAASFSTQHGTEFVSVQRVGCAQGPRNTEPARPPAERKRDESRPVRRTPRPGTAPSRFGKLSPARLGDEPNGRLRPDIQFGPRRWAGAGP